MSCSHSPFVLLTTFSRVWRLLLLLPRLTQAAALELVFLLPRTIQLAAALALVLLLQRRLLLRLRLQRLQSLPKQALGKLCLSLLSCCSNFKRCCAVAGLAQPQQRRRQAAQD